MAKLIGLKCGMTRVFTEDGRAIPATVIKVEPNRVVQIKEIAKDGYYALQITQGVKSLAKLTKAMIGHFRKASVEPGSGLWELPLAKDDIEKYKVGAELKVDLFKVGDKVDVQGVCKGKGFAGVIKRYNFATQDASHGNSLSHRAPGSIGQRQTPGRVFKGKKMAGHMGDRTCTVQSQKVVFVDAARNLLLVEGGVPGAPNSQVVIKHAAKVKAKGGDHGA